MTTAQELARFGIAGFAFRRCASSLHVGTPTKGTQSVMIRTPPPCPSLAPVLRCCSIICTRGPMKANEGIDSRCPSCRVSRNAVKVSWLWPEVSSAFSAALAAGHSSKTSPLPGSATYVVSRTLVTPIGQLFSPADELPGMGCRICTFGTSLRQLVGFRLFRRRRSPRTTLLLGVL